MTKEFEAWGQLLAQKLNRRTVIRGGVLGAAGLTTAALIGCGDDDDDDDDDDDGGGDDDGGATGTPTATATTGGGGDDDGGGGGAEPDYIRLAREDGSPFPYGWAEPDTTPVSGGTLELGVTFTHASFDHLVSGGGTTQTANALIGDFLVGYAVGPQLNVYAMDLDPDAGLATDWEVAPDGLSITFNLRQANFHNLAPVNGRALVAEDVALAFGRMLAARQAGLLLGVNSVEAVDDSTVQFNMDRPNADLLIVLGNRELPIYPQEVYDAGEQDTNPIGTGPAIYDPSNTVQDQTMAFVKNPDYWGGAPLLDGVNLQTIQDLESRNAAFRTGQIHHGNAPQRLEEFDAIWSDLPNMNVMGIPVLMGIQIYAVNSNVAPFDDTRVRRAIKFGMDVDRYLAIRFPGQRFPDSVPAFGWPFYSDTYPGRESFGSTAPLDRDEAMKLLSAAGVEPGLQVRYRSPEGFAGSPLDQDLLIEDMREIGLEVDKLPADGQAFSNQYYAQGWSDPERRDSEMLAGWSTASPTANGYFWENIHSGSSTQHFNIVNSTVDDLADRQFQELDPAARREIHKEIVDLFNEEAYFMDKVPAQRSTFQARPEVRFYRFHGPYIGLHSFWDWGYGFHKAWLDPDPPAESLTVDLRE